MIPPAFTISANDRNVRTHFEELPKRLRARLRTRITALTLTLHSQVRAAEPRLTGKLRSQTRAFVDERQDRIRGRVRILGTTGQPHNIAAAALEYGVRRAVHVKAHPARLTRVFGQSIAPQVVQIRAHTRRVNIAARRFLRGPAHRIRARGIAEIQEAVAEALTQRR